MAFNKSARAPRFTYIFSGFELEPDRDIKLQIDEIREIYNVPPVKNAVLNDILRGGGNRFTSDGFIRSASEQRRCRDLNARAQDAIINKIVRQRQIGAALSKAAGGKNLGRAVIFTRTDDTNEALQFNQRLQDVYLNHPEQIDQMRYEAIMDSFKLINVKSPRDLSRLYELSDEELLAQYEQVQRCAMMMAEAQFLRDPKKSKLTEAQRNALAPYMDLGIQLAQVIEARVDMMANPYFVMYDPNCLFHEGVDALELSRAAASAVEHGRIASTAFMDANDGMFHPLSSFFVSLSSYAINNGLSMPYRFATENPDFNNAVFSSDLKPGTALQEFQTVVVHTQDGRDLVMNNTRSPKLISAADYTKQLSDQAAKADKWLLTGSKEFANMQKAVKELSALEGREGVSREEKAAKNDEVIRTTEAYLKRKKVDLTQPLSYETLKNMGKNRREYSRLEAAVQILKYARAKDDSLKKVEKKEKEAAAKPKVKEEPKPINPSNMAPEQFQKHLETIRDSKVVEPMDELTGEKGTPDQYYEAVAQILERQIAGNMLRYAETLNTDQEKKDFFNAEKHHYTSLSAGVRQFVRDKISADLVNKVRNDRNLSSNNSKNLIQQKNELVSSGVPEYLKSVNEMNAANKEQMQQTQPKQPSAQLQMSQPQLQQPEAPKAAVK